MLILFSSACLYWDFWQQAPALWYSASHDRNGHYKRSQNIAYALRQGDIGSLVKEIHAATVWPALHPVITGTVLAIGGIDYRVAVIPSLIAWYAICWYSWALARLLSPAHKNFAGLIALLMTIASPAYRAYAVDIMLESLGAALTLATLYEYVLARQQDSVRHARRFSLLFLALYMTKYNYWTLLAFGLLADAIREYHTVLLAFIRGIRFREAVHLLLRALFHPLTIPMIPAFGLAFYVKFIGPLDTMVAGRRLFVETLNFPALVCYVLVLLRIMPWWWKSGRGLVDQLPVVGQQMVRWLLYPLALWFLWPQRLGIFLWYVTFTQHGRSADASPWFGNLHYYWNCLTHDYMVNSGSAAIMLVLIGFACLGWRKWGKGASAVFIFLAVATLLTNYHSANRSRFLHSWLTVAWVIAGVGAAQAIAIIENLKISWRIQLQGAYAPRSPLLRLACILALLAFQGTALFRSGQAEEGGPKPADSNLLCLADSLREELLHAKKPVLVSEVPLQYLIDWRMGEKGDRRKLPTPPVELLQADSESRLDAWLQKSACDVLFVIDVPPVDSYQSPIKLDLSSLREHLNSARGYRLESETHFSETGITSQIWRRLPMVEAPQALFTSRGKD